jgi:hypothetical protein
VSSSRGSTSTSVARHADLPQARALRRTLRRRDAQPLQHPGPPRITTAPRSRASSASSSRRFTTRRTPTTRLRCPNSRAKHTTGSLSSVRTRSSSAGQGPAQVCRPPRSGHRSAGSDHGDVGLTATCEDVGSVAVVGVGVCPALIDGCGIAPRPDVDAEAVTVAPSTPPASIRGCVRETARRSQASCCQIFSSPLPPIPRVRRRWEP